MMKKNYIVPQMEAVEIKQSASLLAGSGVGGNGGLDPVIGPGTGEGGSTPRSSELDKFFMNFE